MTISNAPVQLAYVDAIRAGKSQRAATKAYEATLCSWCDEPATVATGTRDAACAFHADKWGVADQVYAVPGPGNGTYGAVTWVYSCPTHHYNVSRSSRASAEMARNLHVVVSHSGATPIETVN